MKNELLLSTILLLNPISSVSAGELDTVKRTVSQGMQHLADMIFESSEPKRGSFWRWNDDTRQSDEFYANYKVKVTFRISRGVERSGYSFNGYPGNGEMDYEVFIEKVDANTGELLSSQDSVFFAKRLAKNKFRIFDCNSTSNCYEDETHPSHADMYVFNTQEGRILKTIKNSQHYFDESIFEDKVLHEAK